MKNNKSGMTKKNKIYIIIGAGLIILSLLIILSFELVPLFAAKAEFRKIVGNIEANETVRVTAEDFFAKAEGDLLPNGTEYSTDDKTIIAEAKALFLSAVNGAKIAGSESILSGDWDIRLRFHMADKTVYAFYLTEENIYMTAGDVRYYFTPGNETGFGELLEFCRENTAGN